MSVGRQRALAWLGLVATLVVGGYALAQRAPYGAERYATPRGENIAGKFDYYALVLSWSPTHCAEAQRGRDELQCERRDGRRYAFVLHGLWPQHDRGYPESCFVRRNFVPRPVIDDMLDIMPAPGLVVHEYKKHGTCSGLEPARYFSFARQLYNRIRIPKEFQNPMEAINVSPDEIEHAFIQANPGMKPDNLAVSCSGNRLQEIRFCFSKDGNLRACGQNENQRRMCSLQKIYMPPVRSIKGGPDTKTDRDRATPPSGARVVH